MGINYLTPFSDWLSISYPTSCSPHHDILSYLSSLDLFGYSEMGRGKELYQGALGGTCFITSKDNYVNLSISGGVLSRAREAGTLHEFQSLLSSAPHNVTRLDAAYDVPVPGHKVISGIQSKFPQGTVEIAGKVRKLQYLLDQNSAGQYTGTVYFQSKSYKGTIKLRVYDKAHEQLEKSSVTIPPTTRYELTVSRGASLRDFACPDSIFWHFLPQGLLPKPNGVPSWSPTERIDYDQHSISRVTDYERLKYFIQNSPALVELVRKASQVNGGSVLLEREIKSLLSQYAEGMQRSGNPAVLHVTGERSTVLDG